MNQSKINANSNRFPFGWILRSENFHPSQYAPHPVILRGAKGDIAESINIEGKILLRFTVEEKKIQANGFNNPAEDRQDS